MEEKDVLERLKEKGIPFERTEHPAVYTIEEMEAEALHYPADVCKNLFLRDAKGKRHFLVVMEKNKRADLDRLHTLLGTSKLSFASEDRLMRYLGLTKGAVTPLGILNDHDHAVEVVLDRDLEKHPRLGVHPCVNTATVWLAFSDLRRLIEENGNRICLLDL